MNRIIDTSIAIRLNNIDANAELEYDFRGIELFGFSE